MDKKDKPERKNVYIHIRETQAFKDVLLEQSARLGFKDLSEYIRDMWRKWL